MTMVCPLPLTAQQEFEWKDKVFTLYQKAAEMYRAACAEERTYREYVKTKYGMIPIGEG